MKGQQFPTTMTIQDESTRNKLMKKTTIPNNYDNSGRVTRNKLMKWQQNTTINDLGFGIYPLGFYKVGFGIYSLGFYKVGFGI